MNTLDWNAALSTLKQSLPPAQYQNWVRPIQYIHHDENTIRLSVPSKFHEEMVRSRFTDSLKKAIRNQCGSELQLEFEIQLREENTEASHSLDTLPQATARPSLRLIANETETGLPVETPVKSEPLPDLNLNNYPVHNTPFLMSGYNRFAYQCAMLFADGNDTQVNPLIIQSAVGMGKTHLLSEIGEAIHRRNPNLKIRYVNFEAFTSEMVQSFNNKTTQHFQYKYRWDTDVLLFDDVAGLAGRKRSQEELLHIFNELLARGGRIAFTTSQPLSQVADLIAPLRSRLLSGVLTEIKSPTFEEKVELLGQASFHCQIGVDATVLRQIADQGQSDIRELIGRLFRIHLQSKIQNKTLNSEFLASEGWRKEPTKEAITLDEIISLVEHNYGITRVDLISKCRKESIVWARQVAMYLARRYTLMPLEEIGRFFGKGHATVIHAFDKVADTIKVQPTQGYQVEFLMKKLEARSPKDNYELPI